MSDKSNIDVVVDWDNNPGTPPERIAGQVGAVGLSSGPKLDVHHPNETEDHK